jgi:hypothetical protein
VASVVDVVTLNPTSFELRFYPASAKGAQGTDRVYAVSAGAQLLSQRTVTGDAQGLDIAGQQKGHAKRFEYRKTGDTWTLGRGETSITQRESLEVQVAGEDRSERRRIVAEGGGAGSDVISSFYNPQGRLVRQTQPGAAATLFACDVLGSQCAARTSLPALARGRCRRNGAVWSERCSACMRRRAQVARSPRPPSALVWAASVAA